MQFHQSGLGHILIFGKNFAWILSNLLVLAYIPMLMASILGPLTWNRFLKPWINAAPVFLFIQLLRHVPLSVSVILCL